MTPSWKYLLGLLGLVAIAIGLSVISFPDQKFHLIACNVGEGDAILAVYGKTQILVDGGPGRAVLDCLSRHMPFWDKELELVLLTHPDKDHFGGLIEVFKNYQIDNFAATPLDSSSQEYEVLKKEVGGSGTTIVNPTAGTEIRLDLIHLDILHPSMKYVLSESDFSDESKDPASGYVFGGYTSKRDPNEFSIVAVLSFKDFDALLTGDIDPEGINEILSQGRAGEVEYIKIPHHGSKNGLTQRLLDVSAPEIAVISVGKNAYGHPHQEVIKLLNEKGIKTLRTDEKGDIEVITDGEKWRVKN